ncbi:MAG: CocE/NonD family hydrolase [Pseudomonadales bacterium]
MLFSHFFVSPKVLIRIITLFFITSLFSVGVAASDAKEVDGNQYTVITEKDVRIPLSDGSYLVADIFRPDSNEKFPVIMSMGLYQKDLDYLPHGANPYGHRETENPNWWVPKGYIQIRVDSRGAGKSPGVAKIFGRQESLDYYEAIEWAGAQSWGNGSVGLSGVSYYAVNQWIVASLQPPSLKAIIPWEGFSDFYRDAVFPGGIFNQGLLGRWVNHVRGRQLLEHTRTSNTKGLEDHLSWEAMVNNLDGDYWSQVRGKADFDKIKIPVYSAANWDGWNLHLRGNLEGYNRVASENKRLRIHVGGHTEAFYSEEGQLDRLQFFDHWLKGKDNGLQDEPPVKVFVRSSKKKQVDPFTSATEGFWREENEWPIARTEYRKFYLSETPANATDRSHNDGSLKLESDKKQRDREIEAGVYTWARKMAHEPVLTYTTPPFEETTEITGHIKLKLWVSSETGDMDVFAKLHKLIDAEGRFFQLTEGDLKVSHRKLDKNLSTEYRPYHTHDEEQKLAKDDIVPIELEIWPTSMVFQPGERLVIELSPHNFNFYDGVYNSGTHHIYTGGKTASYIQLPVIPERKQ